MTRRPTVLVVALAAALAVAGGAAAAPVTLARLTASSTAAATFVAGTLAPPTSLSAAGWSTVALGWTPSTSTAATGYSVLRSATSGSGYAQVGTVTPVSAAAGSDVPGPGTWYYVLQTYLGGWTSGNSNQASVVVPAPVLTATVGCASQAAVTTGSGDNNGYEGSPTNACAQDAKTANDNNTGTNTVNSCTDTGKDRHRFWGYSFGLPGSVHVVSGIRLTAVIGENNTTGTTVLCAQLSPDGGTTWTAAKSVTLTATALTTYTLGGTSDTWGLTWTPAQLSSTNFRIQLTDVSTVTNKNFLLDYIGAAVQYTP